MSAHHHRTVTFEAGDGTRLGGDLTIPVDAVAAAIVCHPHPRYGGNRFNPVVDAIHRRLPDIGVASLRFDFREQFDGGAGELLDASSALDLVASEIPGRALIACGYSFGAMIALSLDRADLAGRVLVAPPLSHLDTMPATEPHTDTPTLVLTPVHDQFAPPGVVQPIVETWTDSTFETIDTTDHFITGRTDHVADRVADWVSGRWPPRSPR